MSESLNKPTTSNTQNSLEQPSKPLASGPTFNKNNPFYGKIIERRLLNKPGSQKETIHCSIDITGSEIQYHHGDAVGIYPSNNLNLVQEILNVLKIAPSTQVTILKKNLQLSFQEALTHFKDIHEPTRKILEALSSKTQELQIQGSPLYNSEEAQALQQLLNPQPQDPLNASAPSTAQENTFLKEYLNSQHIIDVIHHYPVTCNALTPQEWIDLLKPLNPRLYSIASSPTVYPNRIHITVGVVRYEMSGRLREGVASTFLADRAELHLDEKVPLFVTHSHFKLPENKAADIILIGPGTGIAPFRGFIQERIAAGATGRNWLFFGDQYRAFDFLYEEEWVYYLEKEHLHQLDLAFSRDQEEKVYVQHKMLDQGAKLWDWIQRGAYLYVCGDAQKMAPDVDKALKQICQNHGKMTPDETEIFIKTLKKDRRYQRDVY